MWCSSWIGLAANQGERHATRIRRDSSILSRLPTLQVTSMKACKQIWEDLPWFLKPVRYMSQLVAYGTDCPCCLGFRVWVGLALGIIIGYSLG